jgi:hypothetical protein
MTSKKRGRQQGRHIGKARGILDPARMTAMADEGRRV